MTTPRIIPVFTAAQIVRALQTNWGGSDQGTLRSWTGPRVTYSVPTTAPFDVFGGSAETGGFSAPGKPGALTLSGMAALAFELWDDLIAISLDSVGSLKFGFCDSFFSFDFLGLFLNDFL
jgi:hypothetical protein